ncbi:MAG: hypothetical protein Q4P84_04785 [Elusimicrobiales bacterium]|nr:hypothetical protein [Elusimicrobiales bacterium]
MDKNNFLTTLFISPESIDADTIKELCDTYKTPVYEGLAYFFDRFKDLVNNKEYFEYRAKFKKAIYDAYVAEGFTEEQAFALIINDNLQLLKNMNQVNNNIQKKDR